MLVLYVLQQHDDEPRERISRVEHRLRVVVSAIRKPRPPLAGALDFGHNLKRFEYTALSVIRVKSGSSHNVMITPVASGFQGYDPSAKGAIISHTYRKSILVGRRRWRGLDSAFGHEFFCLSIAKLDG